MRQMKHRFYSVWAGFGRAVLLVLLALTTAVLLVLVAVRQTLFDRDLLVASAVTPAYVEAVQKAANQNVESECLFFGIDYSYVEDALDTETVQQLSKTYLGDLYDALYSGEAVKELSLSAELFSPGVDAFFASLGEYGSTIDNATRREITQALASTAKAALQSFPYSNILPQLHAYTFGHPLMAQLDTALWITVLLFLGSLAATVFLGAGNKLTSLYRAAGSMWCAAALWFIPFSLFMSVDLPEKLAFDGSLKLLITSLLNAALSRAEWVFGVAFGVLTLFLIVTAALLLHRFCNRNQKEPPKPAEQN